MYYFFKQKTAYEMRISYWSSDVCSSDLRQTEDRYHESHRHNSEGIPQTGIRVPCPRYDILADKREEPAKIARSDMVGDRHGTVANSGRKQFGEKRGSRTISRSGKGAQPQDGEDDDSNIAVRRDDFAKIVSRTRQFRIKSRVRMLRQHRTANPELDRSRAGLTFLRDIT